MYFCVANNWLVVKAISLKLGDLTKFNKFVYISKSISK